LGKAVRKERKKESVERRYRLQAVSCVLISSFTRKGAGKKKEMLAKKQTIAGEKKPENRQGEGMRGLRGRQRGKKQRKLVDVVGGKHQGGGGAKRMERGG